MSEKEKELLKKMSDNLSKLDKENQKYVLGIAEGMAIAREDEKSGKEEKEESA